MIIPRRRRHLLRRLLLLVVLLSVRIRVPLLLLRRRRVSIRVRLLRRWRRLGVRLRLVAVRRWGRLGRRVLAVVRLLDGGGRELGMLRWGRDESCADLGDCRAKGKTETAGQIGV